MTKLLLLLASMFAACTLHPPAYRMLADNHVALTRSPLPAVALGEIAVRGEYESLCRLYGHVEPEPSLGAYVKGALAHELALANLSSPEAPVRLEGELVEVAFRSKMRNASWRLVLRLRSSNGRALEVRSRTQFPTAFLADWACEIVADQFMPAVQLLIREAVLAPGFPALLKDEGRAEPAEAAARPVAAR